MHTLLVNIAWALVGIFGAMGFMMCVWLVLILAQEIRDLVRGGYR
jgi:hypothetical protein